VVISGAHAVNRCPKFGRAPPSIPPSCGRTSIQPVKKGESKSGSARPLARRLLGTNARRLPADFRRPAPKARRAGDIARTFWLSSSA